MELRKDYVLDEWVIVNPKRSERPHDFKSDKSVKESKCYFCPGRENLTPEEIGRVGKREWKIRWFKNKFPAVDEGDNRVKHDGLYSHGDAVGEHEIIVDTDKHEKQIYDLSKEHLSKLLRVYQERMREVGKMKGVKYVSLFKNHGSGAGTSLVHSHTQVLGYNIIPEVVKNKKRKSLSDGGCIYCDVVKKERRSERLCFENEDFVAFTPYASKYNHEVMVMPKKHWSDFSGLSEKQVENFNEIFSKVLKGLKKLDCSFNYYFQAYKDLHFSFHVCPRICEWGGFELSTGHIINHVSPEEAARFYRKIR